MSAEPFSREERAEDWMRLAAIAVERAEKAEERAEALRSALDELHQTLPDASKTKDTLRWAWLAEAILIASVKADDARGDA